jgi:hypothetical protein
MSWMLPSYYLRFGLVKRFNQATRRLTEPGAALTNVDAWGYRQGASSLTDAEREDGLDRTRRAYRFLNTTRFRLGEKQCGAYRELLDECRRENIPTVMVWMPEGAHFQKLYAPGVMEMVEEYLAGIAAEFGSEVIIARDWVRDENDFYDSHHMMRSGAVAFSKRFADELFRRGVVGGSRWSQMRRQNQIERLAKTANHGVAERHGDRPVHDPMVE